MHRLDPAKTLLAVVDVQEKLFPVMPEITRERLVKSTRILLTAAAKLGIPMVYTEQYPKGLGRTISELRAELEVARRVEKVAFSACGEPTFASAIPSTATSVVLVGIETHICVFQTARDLVLRGLQVLVVADAVASRSEENRVLGLYLVERAGAFVAPTETVLFDWLGEAGTETFRELSRLIR